METTKYEDSRLLGILRFIASSTMYAIFSLAYGILYTYNTFLRAFLSTSAKPRVQLGRILWKRKVHEMDHCSSRDFLCIFSSSVEPDYILKPYVSLYALSKHEAVFVETTAGVNIYNSDVHAFVNAAQFDHSVNVIKMPISIFHAVAEKIGPPTLPVTWVSQTGRSGSHFMCQILEKYPGTLFISEPDAPTHIDYMKQTKSISDSEREQLLVSTVRILCKPYPSIDRVCIKTKGVCIGMMTDISKLFPDMKQIFMYRNCKETVSSFLALLSATPFTEVGRTCLDSGLLAAAKRYFMNQTKIHFIRTLAEDNTEAKVDSLVSDSITMFTYMWANYMLIARDAIAHDNNILAVKYEDLVKEKSKTCKAIFEKLELDQKHMDVALTAFDKDSQRGTVLSQTRIGKTKRRIISDQDRIAADVILSSYNLPRMGHDFRI